MSGGRDYEERLGLSTRWAGSRSARAIPAVNVSGAGIVSGRMNGVEHDAWVLPTAEFPLLTTAASSPYGYAPTCRTTRPSTARSRCRSTAYR
jgi:hypothetical protein